MPAAERPAGRKLDGQRVQRTLLAVGAAAYALGAATTTAFSGPANVITALPIIALAVLVVARWPLRPRPLRLTPEESHAAHPWRPWVVLFVLIVAWEVAQYAARGSRAAHPTLSSMTDAVDRFYGLKALVFFLWLWLGAAIVRRGRGRSSGPSSRRNEQPARPEPS